KGGVICRVRSAAVGGRLARGYCRRRQPNLALGSPTGLMRGPFFGRRGVVILPIDPNCSGSMRGCFNCLRILYGSAVVSPETTSCPMPPKYAADSAPFAGHSASFLLSWTKNDGVQSQEIDEKIF